ncbi:MAG: DUF423 domain-containing protein [Micavibrio aeruginosavorus]|uniref:DUF423 domain-containing protein n=1 Tax=Micavibrio aeruginosavorus TaxID=349221 RepID=A0A2W5BUU8_9BACT|nr:MAG: DUF423 domain-containing protein [Micavibrio aeruginosavorus]
MSMRITNFIAALYGFYGVTAGAVGAHVIKNMHSADMVKTAALYALIHAVVLIAYNGGGKFGMMIRWLFVAGVFLFSGAITAKYMLDLSWAGHAAPVGGILLMAGWALMALNAFRRA